MRRGYNPMGADNIDKVEYDGRTKTLYVKLLSGKTFVHYDVTHLEHVSLISSESQEDYYLTHIYDKYRSRTIEP